MNTVFQSYMEKRLKPEGHPEKKTTVPLGPVITISRDYGCPAKRLAGMISSAINQYGYQHQLTEKWSWVGKEIMEKSAKELRLKPDLIKNIANKDDQGMIDDILLSFTNKYYPGDIKIKKTIGDIIKEYAKKGRIIIVGRGGVALLKNVKKSIHIKITAPIEWRINDISKRYMITMAEAEKRIKEVDQHRDHLRTFFANGQIDETAFDVVFNYYSCSEDEIVECILKMMEKRGMFE